MENRINSARNILSENGETKKWITEAGNVWFLKWVLKERYLTGRAYNWETELYAKLYDAPIESSIKSEVDADKFKERSSNATSLIAKGENAKVELNFAKHESEVLPDIQAVKTVITYEFQNTANTNQEVVFSIVLPNTESTMTDLKLGLNLEHIGVIALRGAASKVYQDSLRRNIDPALLEQTGPLSYRLRVFPVLSVTDSKTQGRQRVQFTYISPIWEDGAVTLIPKTDILNLKLNKKSEILTRVLEWNKVLVQDSKSWDDIGLLSGWKTEKLAISTGKPYQNYCNANLYPTLNINKFTQAEKNLTKNIVFFDISGSAGKKSGIKERYQSLVDAWKNNGVLLDIFTYNFEIYPSGYSLNNLEFWGVTDMSKIIDYIDQNDIKDGNIVIVTDDSSYEKANAEIKSIDYKKLRSNRISLIQVGEQVRSLKTEITKSIFATDGTMIIINEKTPLSDSVKNIFTNKKSIETCENYTGPSISLLQSIQWYNDSKKVLEWTESEEIAKTAHIINQSVSLIALENDSQRADLEKYSQGSDKYDTTYVTFSNENSMIQSWSRRWVWFGWDSVSLKSRSSNNSLDSESSWFWQTSSIASWTKSIWSNDTWILHYIIVLMSFPLIAWFILSRKPKIKKAK
jgi:Vault protein inter-alpha-trypsin domain